MLCFCVRQYYKSSLITKLRGFQDLFLFPREVKVREKPGNNGRECCEININLVKRYKKIN